MRPVPGRFRRTGGSVQQSAHTIAQHSYSRCLRAPTFFAHFYEGLLESDPSVPPMFVGTEFPRQHKLLQHGLGLLLSYANKPDPMLLDRIATRHSSGGINVAPGMYGHFVESLIGSVRAHDPKFDAAIEAAWRESLRPGLDFMKSRYAP
jgi:hemoglobin-like flavoprotein